MHPLYLAKKQIPLVIKEIKGNEENKQKCIARGFFPGVEIIIQREQGENIIVKLKSSYFIIGKELAFFIFVQEKILI